MLLCYNLGVIGTKRMENYMKELSSLQIERLKYQPKLPASLAGGINNLNMVEGSKTECVKDAEQIQALLPVVEAESDSDDATINAANFKFTNVQLSEQSPLLGHTSASASLRNKYASLVVAIQRGEEYLKPNGEVIFQPQDIVWLVGDPKVISELK